MTDTKYVTVPREPTPEMIAAGRKVRQDGFSEIAIFDAMIAAAHPSPPPSSVKAREIDAFEAGYIQGHDATVEGRYADPSDAAQDYVRTLLAPAVDERAASSEPEMCPNCVTPWKCNGPHEFPAATSEAPVAWMRAAGVNPQFEPAVISATVKSIWLRVKPARVERYTVPLYTHPAPTTADAGVTDKLVDVVYTAINRLGTPISQATVQAALEAALGAREGK